MYKGRPLLSPEPQLGSVRCTLPSLAAGCGSPATTDELEALLDVACPPLACVGLSLPPPHCPPISIVLEVR